ncbi:MAG: GGDEF domain-containing protein [Ruminococcus sp.]|nr:GGDEF domain-containing protein [Ruminococcus sp.]
MENYSIKTNIAVIVSGIDEEYQYNIICGINKFANENDVNLSYFAAFGGMLGSKKYDFGEYSIYKLIDYSRFDGVILMTNTISDPYFKELVISSVRSAGIPAVLFDCAQYPEFYNVSINNSEAMKNIVRHLITKHDAKVFNYISGPLSNPEALTRYQAFLEVLDECGLTAEKDRIYFGEFRSQDGRQAVDSFFQAGLSLPDAVVCANDAMALTAVTALEKMGFHVPQDVIVTGFDCTYNARNFSPVLTTVKRPLFTAGYKACALLCDIFSGKKPEKTMLLDAYPVFSESCGCVSCEEQDFSAFKKRSYSRSESMTENISLMNRFNASLAEAETDNQLFDVIDKFIAELNCEKFSLCLTEDWEDAFSNVMPIDPDAKYSGFITAPLIWDRGDRRSVGYFPSCKMYPETPETGGNISYFLPLHFRDSTLGYCIITNSSFPINSLLCHSFIMNISSAIENIRRIFHLNRAMDELDHLYSYDVLCGIYNRNGFIKRADEIFKECIIGSQKIMISFIDMDGLKSINDNYGHTEGDFALQRLARIVSDCCLATSICARFGGDEFIILTRDVSEGDDVSMEHRFCNTLNSRKKLLEKPYELSASIGSVIVTASKDVTLYSVIKQADEKMYQLKTKNKMSRDYIRETD